MVSPEPGRRPAALLIFLAPRQHPGQHLDQEPRTFCRADRDEGAHEPAWWHHVPGLRLHALQANGPWRFPCLSWHWYFWSPWMHAATGCLATPPQSRPHLAHPLSIGPAIWASPPPRVWLTLWPPARARGCSASLRRQHAPP